MRKRFTKEQIAGILSENKKGKITVSEVCRRCGISKTTYYEWRKKYGGLFTDAGVENDDMPFPADREFVIYKEQNVTLEGSIRNGCLRLESYVYGKAYDSEKHYDFNAEDTLKLFSLLKFDDFIKLCRKGRLIWMEQFLEDNGIRPKTFCF